MERERERGERKVQDQEEQGDKGDRLEVGLHEQQVCVSVCVKLRHRQRRAAGREAVKTFSNIYPPHWRAVC